jgi:hypothetical protein
MKTKFNFYRNNIFLYHSLCTAILFYIYIYIFILYLKHQFQRSSRVIFLQITPHNYFKLTRCTPIDGQTASRHRPDARGRRPMLFPRGACCFLLRALAGGKCVACVSGFVLFCACSHGVAFQRLGIATLASTPRRRHTQLGGCHTSSGK